LLESVKAAKGLETRLLDDVLGRLDVPQPADGEAIEGVEVRRSQRLELGPPISALFGDRGLLRRRAVSGPRS